MNSEMNDLTSRIRFCTKKVGSGNELSRLTGLSRRALENWLQGRNEPKASAVILIAEKAEVSVSWLLLGEGESGINSKTTYIEPYRGVVDPELQAIIIDGLSILYKELGRKVPPLDQGRMSAKIYNDLAEECDSLDDQRIGLKMYLKGYKAQLIAESNDLVEGKQA